MGATAFNPMTSEAYNMDCMEAMREIRVRYDGFIGRDEVRIHNTQKPKELYKAILKLFAKQGDRILDTHLGSGSSRIAAYDLGFDFVGYELDADYFQAQEERFARHIAQPKLFAPEPVKVEQGGLF